MKKLFTFIVLIFSITAGKTQTIPNAGFESWTTLAEPDLWNSFSTCQQATPGAVGLYYAKFSNELVYISPSSFGIHIGVLYSRSSTLPWQGAGFAYNSRPSNFTGQYQYNKGGFGEFGSIEVSLTKWNTSLMRRDTISYDIQLLTATTSGWTNFNIPIIYSSGDNPDSVSIIFLATSRLTYSASPYASVSIDDLAFTGSIPAGNELWFSISPNPFTSQTTITFSEDKNNIIIKILDLLGKEIKSLNFTGNQLTIEKDDMSRGIYFVQVTDENNNRINKKILIQ
ncbi:MAG: hypothetical protein A3F72_20910 [Bacteroidetes bacterium RIFCSPLOWO2_12_FULL_35_15]|nr:MAG: hypothetical protein A3F72_20910 [Bacteroidetes bacterium RIFCSPLOWO2_12_FULL_35_15]